MTNFEGKHEFGDYVRPERSEYDAYDSDLLAWNRAIRELTNEDYHPFQRRYWLKKIRELSPEEKKLPKTEQMRLKKEGLKKYKELLAQQEEGFIDTILALRESIEESPDDIDNLFQILRNNSSRCRFDENDLMNFGEAIKTYGKNHQIIKGALSEHPSADELFEAAFGIEPKGKVEIVERPMAIAFRCHDVKDVATVLEQSSGQDAERSSEIASKVRGFITGASQIPELNMLLIIENVTVNNENPRPGSEDQTIIHEEQHVYNRLFRPYNDYFYGMIDVVIEQDIPYEEKVNKVVELELRSLRAETIDRSIAENEILAYAKQGMQPEAILEKLQNPTYVPRYIRRMGLDIDSVATKVSERIQVHIKVAVEWQNLPPESTSLFEDDDLKQATKDSFDKVFNERLQADFKRWVGLITDLEASGYTRDEVVAILYKIPITYWGPSVRRAIDRKKKSNSTSKN